MTRPSANRTVKFQMMLSESEIKEIDDFRFANRIGTRAEAIRRMIAIAKEASAAIQAERNRCRLILKEKATAQGWSEWRDGKARFLIDAEEAAIAIRDGVIPNI